MDHFLDDSVDDDDDDDDDGDDDDDDDDHDDADEDEDSDEDGDDNRVVPVTSLDFCSAPYHLLPAQAFGPNLQPKTRSGRSIAQAKPLPSENAHLRPRVDHLGQLGDCLVQ